MPGFILEPAVDGDGEALRELERHCPQGESLAITSERTDWFFRSRLYGDERTLVLRHGSRVVGVMAAALKRVVAGDRERVGAFLYDLRLHPDFRKSLGGVLLVKGWNALEAWARGRGAGFGYGFVKADNRVMRGFFGRKGFSEAGTMTVLGRPVFRRLGARFAARELPEPDGTGFRRFLEAYGARPLFPTEFRDARLNARMKDSGLFSFFDVEDGDSYAGAGLFRISEALATRVWRTPPAYRIAGPLARALSPLVPLPAIPERGGTVRYYHAFDHVAGGPRGMELWRDLMRRFNDLALDAGCQLLTGAFGSGDPFEAAFRRGALSRIGYVVAARSFDGTPPPDARGFAPDVRDMD